MSDANLTARSFRLSKNKKLMLCDVILNKIAVGFLFHLI